MIKSPEKLADNTFQFTTPVKANSPELQQLFDFIALGASERDRDRILPFDIIDLLRRSRLGALRVPVAEGGGGSSLRELFEVIIRLGDADPNPIFPQSSCFQSACDRQLRNQRYTSTHRSLFLDSDVSDRTTGAEKSMPNAQCPFSKSLLIVTTN
ncbi:putative acyl-CoA dehydrogenase [Calothrix brevissima NIES-22]|nr:putative acyl-CoA dehydrogenase [Calothrix brevissima NIES-22]